jgi:predicted DNA-binding protein with PD1-like motif
LIPQNNSNRIHCLRLTPAQDLKPELVQFCKKNQIKAACILSAVGSLQQAHLRLANSSQTLKIDRKFEIVSATGTLSENGCHVHISIADDKGQVLGGHLLDGNLIFTTCELVIMEIADTEFKRELDPATTFNELKIYLKKS